MGRLIWPILVSLAMPCAVAHAQVVIVPWGASDYRYQYFDPPVPIAVIYENYDDSGWPVGSAPFGAADVCGTQASTAWPINKTLVLRKHVTLAGRPDAALYSVAYAGNYELHFNLCPTGSAGTGPGCGSTTNGAPCLRSGDNLITVICSPLRDNFGAYLSNGFDLKVNSDGLTPTRNSSFGHIKTIYR